MNPAFSSFLSDSILISNLCLSWFFFHLLGHQWKTCSFTCSKKNIEGKLMPDFLVHRMTVDIWRGTCLLIRTRMETIFVIRRWICAVSQRLRLTARSSSLPWTHCYNAKRNQQTNPFSANIHQTIFLAEANFIRTADRRRETKVAVFVRSLLPSVWATQDDQYPTVFALAFI